jgi:cell wall-associated NlpC family hydrolase
VRSLLSALLLLLASCFATSDVSALDDAYQRAFVRELRFIIGKHPRYLWGGAKDLTKGLDCSGYVYLAGKWAGIPGIARTTAYRMSLGLDGWTGVDILLEQAQECDLPFWTWNRSPARSNGHVGVFLCDHGQLWVTHASSRKGVVLAPMRGPLRSDLSKVRRLTIGD